MTTQSVTFNMAPCLLLIPTLVEGPRINQQSKAMDIDTHDTHLYCFDTPWGPSYKVPHACAHELIICAMIGMDYNAYNRFVTGVCTDYQMGQTIVSGGVIYLDQGITMHNRDYNVVIHRGFDDDVLRLRLSLKWINGVSKNTP